MQSTLLGELLENAEIGALAVDEGHYVAANEYACELLGWQREELIGRRPGELHPLSELPSQYAEILRGKRSGGQVTITTKTGEPLDLCYRAVPTRLAGMELYIGLFWLAD